MILTLGWKFFCSLFDSDRLSICGEESFGTGSDHIREKDGLWAVVGMLLSHCRTNHTAWLNIIAGFNKLHSGKGNISAVLNDFWLTYGRTFFTRYDFEDVDSDAANKLIAAITDKAITNRSTFVGSTLEGFKVADAGDFEYKDPIDGSVSSHQGIFVKFEDGSRIVVRLSGTGSSGATIRLYIEKYEQDKARFSLDAQQGLSSLIKLAVGDQLLNFQHFIERTEPNVIT